MRAAAALLGSIAVVAVAAASMLAFHTTASKPRFVVEHGIRFGGSAAYPVHLDAYLPRSRRAVPAVVLIHGGGWVRGGRWRWRRGASRLAARGWAAFAIDYRLAPRVRFPAPVDDVRAAVRWIDRHARSLHVDRRRIALLGDSAGGTLAAYVAEQGAGPLPIRAAASWSGPTDLAALERPSTSAYLRRVTAAYIGCPISRCRGRYVRASPVAVAGRGSAPLLIVNSTHELVPLAQARELAARLRRAGARTRLLVFPGTRHAKAYLGDAWGPTLSFLERYLAG